ncbi:S1 RNA-binding domain-containing protein [Candidatus Kaiserbacteria bacterium]|nr:S1 RNA-binding domain-containing protein [Candidatus Kaiserbacteria bacterium]
MLGLGNKTDKKSKEELEVKDSKNNIETEEKQIKKKSIMDDLLSQTPTPPQVGDLVEGLVIAIERSHIFINLPPFGTGIIYGREFMNARDILRKINVGDSIAAKVVDVEGLEGYVELSLKEARQALIWAEAEDAIKNKTILELPVKDANKGGLIIEWQGIQGFLPASQLKAENYPRVEDGDKDRILEQLRALIGTKLAVSVITADPKENKMIFSEKDSLEEDKKILTEDYKIGDELEGEVTGAVEFGVFVKLREGLEGLVHISEMDWALVEDPRTIFKIGEKVNVKVIDINNGKISLSIKALKENPWHEAAKKYKKEDTVNGVIIKYNKHGALASIEEGVAGLVHISEFETDEKLREALELGKTYKFTITLFEPEEQRMTLSLKGEK